MHPFLTILIIWLAQTGGERKPISGLDTNTRGGERWPTSGQDTNTRGGER